MSKRKRRHVLSQLLEEQLPNDTALREAIVRVVAEAQVRLNAPTAHAAVSLMQAISRLRRVDLDRYDRIVQALPDPNNSNHVLFLISNGENTEISVPMYALRSE